MQRSHCARAAFLGGSAATQRRTPTSDLDVVVLQVMLGLDSIREATFLFRGPNRLTP